MAHEDDPERAVRAALAIRDWAREDGRSSCGSGSPPARRSCSRRQPEAGEAMATGDVVNTAARLQAAAPPNGILVSTKTCRATRVIDRLRRGGPSGERQGRADAVWEAELRAARSASISPHGTQFVGRSSRSSPGRCAQARARGALAELVTLVGVPGIGKCRLVFELMRNVEADSEMVPGGKDAPPLRRRCQLLGACRDRQGAGRAGE